MMNENKTLYIDFCTSELFLEKILTCNLIGSVSFTEDELASIFENANYKLVSEPVDKS